MKAVVTRTAGLKPAVTKYCAGCGHGIVHRLVAEVVEEMSLRTRTIGMAPVGCAVYADEYFNFDVVQPAHGRTPAVATGVKRVHPECLVISYQGDGDLAAIGTAEIIHAANRGENITVIFVNNAVYGMTSGQMAPTTLLGQKTATTPLGRTSAEHGHPIKVCELLATLGGSTYLARTSVHTPAHVLKTKRAIRQAFELQMAGRGFTLVEVLSMCPTNWGLAPQAAVRWIEERMLPVFPPGEWSKA
jgi:2-oxoglutarate ferredoxin oxidoreductase subunit beta